MKLRFSQLLSMGLAVAVSASTAGWAPARASGDHPAAGGHTVFVDHPAKKHKKKHHQKKHKRHHQHHYQDHPHYGHVQYVVDDRHSHFVVRPVYANSFIVFQPRFIVVRPVPHWVYPSSRSGVTARLGVHIGNVDFAIFLNERKPLHGCNFCDARFTRYDDWEEHVVACPRRSARRVIPEPWDEDDLVYFRDRASSSFESYQDDYDDDYDDYYDD